MPHSALRDEKVPQHKLGDRHMISRDDLGSTLLQVRQSHPGTIHPY